MAYFFVPVPVYVRVDEVQDKGSVGHSAVALWVMVFDWDPREATLCWA